MIILNAIGQILSVLLNVYCWVIFITAILYMAQANPYSQLMMILTRITEPAYSLVRRVIRKTDFNGIDFSPLIVIVILQFINLTLLRFLMSL